MTKSLFRFAVAALAFAALAFAAGRAPAQSAYEDDTDAGVGMMGMMAPGMMGMGMGMGHGMMGMGHGMTGMGPGMTGMGPLMMLDLSDDQRARINNIHDALRRQHWEIMGRIMDDEARLRDLYDADVLDKNKIVPTYRGIFDQRLNMIGAHIDAVNQINKTLTAEQREQLKQMRRGRWPAGRGPMMGPGR